MNYFRYNKYCVKVEYIPLNYTFLFPFVAVPVRALKAYKGSNRMAHVHP